MKYLPAIADQLSSRKENLIAKVISESARKRLFLKFGVSPELGDL